MSTQDQLDLFETNVAQSARIIRRELRCMAVAGVPLRKLVKTVKELYIEAVVEVCDGNHCKAADLVDTHRNTVRRAIGRKHPGSVGAEEKRKAGVA